MSSQEKNRLGIVRRVVDLDLEWSGVVGGGRGERKISGQALQAQLRALAARLLNALLWTDITSWQLPPLYGLQHVNERWPCRP